MSLNFILHGWIPSGQTLYTQQKYVQQNTYTKRFTIALLTIVSNWKLPKDHQQNGFKKLTYCHITIKK